MKVVIVGAGSAGSRHASTIESVSPDSVVTVVRSLDEIEALAPDIGVIASPASTHAQAIDLLRGAHLLIEKPLTTTVAQARALLDTSPANGAVELVGYNLRFTTSLQRLRSELQSGSIGRPLSVRCSTGQWLPKWRPDADYRTGVTAQRSLGGGVLLELSHEFDYLTWLFGVPSWVIAHVAQVSDLEIDVEDSAEILMGFEPEVGRPAIGNVSLDLFRRNGGRECTVIGSEGSLRWDAVAGTVELFDDATVGWQVISRTNDDVRESYTSQWRHFLDCINGNAEPLITPSEGIDSLRVVEACVHSSVEGRRVEVERA